MPPNQLKGGEQETWLFASHLGAVCATVWSEAQGMTAESGSRSCTFCKWWEPLALPHSYFMSSCCSSITDPWAAWRWSSLCCPPCQWCITHRRKWGHHETNTWQLLHSTPRSQKHNWIINFYNLSILSAVAVPKTMKTPRVLLHHVGRQLQNQWTCKLSLGQSPGSPSQQSRSHIPGCAW